ncbi:MAG TPA: hypothetical protein VM243_07680 [Phycisphaerae bacterium]|nr:hypothetical protein [Phycisphaerae bacterium]
MDPGSDVTGPSSAAGTPAKQPGVSKAVRCDQAIFTSVGSAIASGYRLVAASRGLKTEEKQQIIKCSPSHDGLCDTSPEAVGVSCYPLATGRLAVAYTCCAGLEQSARGGQRIYTRAVVLAEEDLGTFAYNPFDVVRSLIAGGGGTPDLKPPTELPALELSATIGPDYGTLSDCVGTVGIGWTRCVLDHLLAGRPTVIVGDFGAAELIEAVLLGLPGPLRARLSFAAGLRYSLARGFGLSALAGDPVRLRQSLRGHEIDLLEPAADQAGPAPADGAWGRMVQHRWEQGRWSDLVGVTSRRYGDCSAATLDRCGELCARRDELSDLDCDGLIGTLNKYAGTAPQEEPAGELTATLVSDALRELTDRLCTAPIDDLTRYWGAVTDLWKRSAATSVRLSPLVAGMLKRMTRLSPIAAAKAASRLLASVGVGRNGTAVRQALDDLLDHLGEWLHDQPIDGLRMLEAPLRHWPPSGALGDRVRQLEQQLAARVADQPAAGVEAAS